MKNGQAVLFMANKDRVAYVLAILWIAQGPMSQRHMK